jgi:alpha-galactosidase
VRYENNIGVFYHCKLLFLNSLDEKNIKLIMDLLIKIKKTKRLHTIIVSLLFTAFLLNAQSSQHMSVPGDLTKWITSSFEKGKTPPFSFVLGGKASSEFIKSWIYSLTKERSDEPQVVRYCVSYLDQASGLRVDCHIKGFEDFNAVEWVLNFVNTSANNSSILENVNAVDFTAISNKGGSFVLLHVKGSNAERSDFEPLTTILKPGERILLQPNGGRSSDDTGFPFFTIESPDNSGIVAAIGWSGDWFSEIKQASTKAVTLKAGMTHLKLFLFPGETIRTPSICMLFWKSEDMIAGQNAFRHFLLTHHSRTINGKFVEYPISGGFNWGDPYPCNEYSCLTEDYALALINRYKQFGITPEVFWLDAGWFPCPESWDRSVGNWEVDSTRFPNGLRPISDAAHKVGAKFMVWFEPERVFKNTLFDKTHPEWLLTLANNENKLFNLGDAQAREWLAEYFGDFIEKNGIDYYRQDFNIRPGLFWAAHDKPGRIGITEIRYIEGLYAYWDYLLKRFPNLVIDNCASGGRRLDLETISRSAPLWRTDYIYGEPNGYQCHTYGLSLFLPLSGTGLNRTDLYAFRSSLGSAVVLNWKLTSHDMSIPEMQNCLKEFREIRPYFYEDYYPLTGLIDLTGEDVWLAYQLDRPSDKTGVVVAFRRKDNLSETLSVKLKGINEEGTYTIYNSDNKTTIIKKGKELREGLILEIKETPGSILLMYHEN